MCKRRFLAALLVFMLCINTSHSVSFLKKYLFKKAYTDIQGDRKLLQDSREAWIEQKLDNFHPTDDRTWFQRYFIEGSYSKSDGPVFLSIGGEGPAAPVWMNNGHWIDMAKKVNALCFQLEHRFYGLSQPTKDVSLTNLVYLSSEQALADLSSFITSMNDKYSLHNRKWIVFGGSYPGSLALWARLKYPHLISGSVSASAPLNALLDFSGYNQVVQHSLNTLGDAQCSERIRIATTYLADLLNTEKFETVHQQFATCKRLSSFDVEYFQQSLADNVAEVVQYNRDARGFERNGAEVMNITELCSIMRNNSDTQHPETLLHNYAEVNRRILAINNIQCMDVSYQKYLEEMRNSSWDAAPSAREWQYQTCTEFGWFQTATPSTTQPFRGFPVSFFQRECQMLFGVTSEEMTEAIQRTNMMYGKLQLVQHITNATLYNGMIDPWSNVSYTGQFHSNLPIQVVPDTAHCAIMYPSSRRDSADLLKARTQVEMEVAKWLR